MITSYIRGHLAEYQLGKWIYSDDGLPARDNRTCKRCGEFPTVEGYDACIGYVEGAGWACCGHGISKPYAIMEN